MTYSLADLRDDNTKWLDQIAAGQGKLRAAVLALIVRWHAAKLEARS